MLQADDVRMPQNAQDLGLATESGDHVLCALGVERLERHRGAVRVMGQIGDAGGAAAEHAVDRIGA